LEGARAGATLKTDARRKRPWPLTHPGVDPKLLEILVCPGHARTALNTYAAAGELISRQAGLAFPIRDGIPILLIDEARPLDQPRTPSEGQ
jgi:uncharacterized protein YbaR (Trm112 family)